MKSGDLRRLTWRHPKLIMDALERVHRQIDKAERKLSEALDDAKADRADRAAMFILSHSAAARERGWCSGIAAIAMTLRRLQLRRRW